MINNSLFFKKIVLERGETGKAKYNIDRVLKVFRMLEEKDTTKFPELISRDLEIYKNDEVLTYDQAFDYVKSLEKKYQSVKVFPFEIALAVGDRVVAKFTQELHSYNGDVSFIRFIAIFTISKEGKISKIEELVL